MKNIIALSTLFIILILSSCSNGKCKDCTLLFESEFSENELDSIVKDLSYFVGGYTTSNGNTIDTIFFYSNWNDFMYTNFYDYTGDLNKEVEICNNAFTTGPNHLLDEAEDINDTWWSNGKMHNDGSDDIFILGRAFYNCR
ncbi:MAG: hypothetical protein HN535_01430 [Flavobacteriales bacterium]|nr:hypothetical protein [Flavobacteriales bacterium]